MLSEAEQYFVCNYAYCTDHEWRFWGELCGEPFLIDQCLCFFDGTALTVIGYTLDGSHITSDRLADLISSNKAFAAAKYIWFWGPDHIEEPQCISGFTFSDWSDGILPAFGEARINLEHFSLAKLRNARSDLNRGKNKGLTVSSVTLKILGYEHIRCVEQLHANRKLSLLDLALASALRAYVALDLMRVWEVRLGDRLCGWTLVSEVFPKCHIFLLGFFDRSPNGIGDLAYFSVINHAINCGAQYLNLGSCGGVAGIYAFKMKWGAELQHNGPYHHFFFKDGVEPPVIDGGVLPWTERMFKRRITAS